MAPQIPPGACDPNPCVNGTCEGTVGGATCDCDAGWGGATCSLAEDDPCDPNPCVNGTCVRDDGVGRCECFRGWEGTTCASTIAGAVTNPVLHINDCSVELVAPQGWTDNGDGSFTTNGTMGFNVGGRVIEMTGPTLTYDTVSQSFSGSLTSLPWPGFEFLSGSGMVFDVSTLAGAEVMTGAEVQALIQPREAPLPDELEVLAFTMNLDTPTFAIPGTDTTLGRDEVNAIGFYFDPCDPLAFFSMAGDLAPPLGPVTIYAMGGSLDQNFSNESMVDLWQGPTDFGEPIVAPMTATGGVYLAGELSFDQFGVPIGVDGTFLVNVDPDRNGTLATELLGGLMSGSPFLDSVTPASADYSILGNGSVVPDIPLLGEVLAFFSNGEIALSLADGSLYVDRSDGGGAYFRGTNDVNPLEGTLIADFFPQAQTYDVMGYVRDIDDWGLYYSTQVHFFAGLSAAEAGVSLVVDDSPELGIAATVDLGTIDFVPGVTISLGSVPMRFTVELTTGLTCGETGYEGADFECMIGVCVGESGWDFYPSCEFPSGFPCVEDSMCISNACSSLVPEAACADGCSVVRDGCTIACDATRTTCDGTCDATEATCTGACIAATETCGAGCDATDATCSGTCTATGTSCRGVCTATEATCGAGCTAAQGTCNGTCNATQTACEGVCTGTGATCRGACDTTQGACSVGCSAAQGTCNAGCDAVQGTCNAGCSAGTGVCDATYETCRAGCIAACYCWTVCAPWPFDDECWSECTCDRGGCIDDCASARTSCRAAIVNPCVSACASANSSCRSGCTSGLGSCNNTCTSTGNSCRGTCTTTENGCRSGCVSTGNGCRTGCSNGLASCNSTCAGTGNTCRGSCNTAQSDCQGGCDTATSDCDAACAQAETDCTEPCVAAGDDCHGGCESAFSDCDSPCQDAYGGCVDGCELVGTCD